MGMGFDEKEKIRHEQIRKKRNDEEKLKQEMNEKLAENDSKYLPKLEINYDFSKNDFNNVMEAIRVVASKYDSNHPAAPSLAGTRLLLPFSPLLCSLSFLICSTIL